MPARVSGVRETGEVEIKCKGPDLGGKVAARTSRGLHPPTDDVSAAPGQPQLAAMPLVKIEQDDSTPDQQPLVVDAQGPGSTAAALAPSSRRRRNSAQLGIGPLCYEAGFMLPTPSSS